MADDTRPPPSAHLLPRFVGAYQNSDASLEARIGSHVTVRPDGCWIYGESDGYKQVLGADGVVPAHRWFYETLVGPIPEGHHLHHECGTPACVNPEHLTPLTPAEHVLEHRGRELDMTEVRELRDRGWSYRQIADRFGVSRMTIRRRVTGKR
jgi:hypothetical protein